MKGKKIASLITVLLIVAFSACLLTGCHEIKTDIPFGNASYWYNVYTGSDKADNGWAQTMYGTVMEIVRGGDMIAVAEGDTHVITLSSDSDGWHIMDIRTTGPNINATIEVKYTTTWKHYKDITITPTETSYDLDVIMSTGTFSRGLYPTSYRITFTAPVSTNVQISWRRGFQQSTWNPSKGVMVWNSDSHLSSPHQIFTTEQITYVPAKKVKEFYDTLKGSYFYDRIAMVCEDLQLNTVSALLSSADSAITSAIEQLNDYTDGDYHVAIAFGIGDNNSCVAHVYPFASKNTGEMEVFGEIAHKNGTFHYAE